MMVKKQSQWQRKYDDNHVKGVYLKLNLVYDADILEKLDSVENRQGYIKELIRNDIKRSGVSRKQAHLEWEHMGKSVYRKNGWEVWTTGSEWKIRRSDGFVYAQTYQSVGSAMKFAEKRMK